MLTILNKCINFITRIFILVILLVICFTLFIPITFFIGLLTGNKTTLHLGSELSNSFLNSWAEHVSIKWKDL